jgi:group I intron endonuclease
MLVYLITNSVNGKQYVGQTAKELVERWKKHVAAIDTERAHYLHKALKKYGLENFVLETLHECVSKEEMDFVEMFYISLLNTKVPNGYNLTDGGEGTLGHRHSEASILKMKESHKGFIFTKELRAKLSAVHLGVPKSAEHRRNMSLSRKGIPTGRPAWSRGLKGAFKHTEEAKKRISEGIRKHFAENVKMAICHPEKKAYAKGLCQYCYNQQFYLKRKNKPKE